MSKRLSLRKVRKPNIKGASFSKEKTDNKQITNGYQTDNKQITKQITNGYQTDNRKITGEYQTDNKQITERITKQITNGYQTDNKQITKPSFESLVGHEKNLLLLIFKECLRTGNLVTPSLTLSFITQSLECSSGTAKIAIHRLIKKGFTWRNESKTGRGGWIKFGLSKSLYQSLRIRETDNKQITNGYQTDNKQVAQRIAQRITNATSSSSILNNNKNITTTTELPEKWETIKITRSIKDLGFGALHIRQIHKNGTLEAQEVQDSLNAFSHDLENGKVKARNGSLNLLMGVLLKKGMYISEDYLTESKKEIDAYLTKVEELEAAKEKLKEVNKQKQFEKWLETISDEKKDQIVPPSDLIKSGGPFQIAMLKGHWEKEVIREVDANNNQ